MGSKFFGWLDRHLFWWGFFFILAIIGLTIAERLDPYSRKRKKINYERVKSPL